MLPDPMQMLLTKYSPFEPKLKSNFDFVLAGEFLVSAVGTVGAAKAGELLDSAVGTVGTVGAVGASSKSTLPSRPPNEPAGVGAAPKIAPSFGMGAGVAAPSAGAAAGSGDVAGAPEAGIVTAAGPAGVSRPGPPGPPIFTGSGRCFKIGPGTAPAFGAHMAAVGGTNLKAKLITKALAL